MTDRAPARPEGGPGARIVVDGRSVAFKPGDSVAVAIIRANEVPAGGGTLCLAGDCGNCVAQVDGTAYARTCQTPARPGLSVVRHPANGLPPLPVVTAPDPSNSVLAHEVGLRRRVVDVAIVGGGPSGRAAEREAIRANGGSVLVLDANDGEEVAAVYRGPLLVARTRAGMLQVHAPAVVIATGAAEIHPVCPGNDLAGLLTRGAAGRLHAAGVQLVDAVAVGTPPDGVPCAHLVGRLVRFEGAGGRVTAVVTADEDTGVETRTPCSTVILGLGTAPRDMLARMAAAPEVTLFGAAAEKHALPPAPTDGIVCPCSGTRVADLEVAWDKGYTGLELLKRATLAGLGTCQGGACLPHLRSWIGSKRGEPPAPFTARPAARQITLGEAGADTFVDAFRRTPLHDEHLALGARMDRFGSWWRPWHYGDPVAEYWAVRRAVSLGDVSTLGKLVASGPDVVEALERLFPCHVADIQPGRARYALLLDERGHVMDDGMIVRESETRFVLSFTSSGAAYAAMWIRDWIERWGLRVHVLDRTMSLGAINVTGPLAATLLQRAGLAHPPRFLGHVRADVAGVPCHVMRLSFTGEAAFELHHPVDRSVELWRGLMELGRDLGARPHGLQALQGLRLEKGHVIVGMDTELDSTPHRLGMDWAVRLDKPWFVGQASLQRTAKLPDRRRLFGFTMPGAAPAEGSPIWSRGDIIGQVTGSWASPVLGHVVMLGWQRRAPFVDRVEIDGREAVVSPLPFYDPGGLRARA